MSLQPQLLFALEIARERTREAEARARLRWGMDPEPTVAHHVARRFAALCRMACGPTERNRNGRCARLEVASTQLPDGRVAA